MIWADGSLDLITIVSAIYCNAFFLSWPEQTWQTCNLLVQMTIYGENSYLGQIFRDAGYNLWLWSTVNIHTSTWPPHILLKTLDSSALKLCQNTTRRRKIIPHTAAIHGFQTEMTTRRQNLRTAALNKTLVLNNT